MMAPILTKHMNNAEAREKALELLDKDLDLLTLASQNDVSHSLIYHPVPGQECDPALVYMKVDLVYQGIPSDLINSYNSIVSRSSGM